MWLIEWFFGGVVHRTVLILGWILFGLLVAPYCLFLSMPMMALLFILTGKWIEPPRQVRVFVDVLFQYDEWINGV